MDIVSYILSTTFTKKALQGVGFIKGSPCTIQSVVDNPDGTHNITFSWKDNNNVTHTSVLTVKDGQTPSIASVPIANGHRVTFATTNPSQSVTFDVMNGNNGQQGISVVGSNVDTYNHLTFTLSNGNTIDAGYINAVTNVDNVLSHVSTNPVENKVITDALDTKVDKETGKGLFSDTEKNKLANIEDNAQVNVIEKLIVNGQEATITDKSIALTIITSAVSNLQNYYLKTETYTKQEVEDLIGSTVGVTIEIVEQLPTEGQSNIIYFLPTETQGVYSQYIYTTDGWILIGSTTVDLSNYYTKVQVDALLNGKQNVLTIDAFPTALSNNPVASGGVYSAIASMQPQFQFANMPVPSATNLGFVYQYIGTAGTYEPNMFYRCVYKEDIGEYQWVEVIFHATVTVDSELSSTSTNPVQNKVIKEALDTKQDIMQYSTMPSAQDNLGKIVQYIGTNTANYTNGYFYKAIYDSESDVYLWTVIKFSADMLVDNALSTTSENPVQNKVITSEINGIKDLIPQEASSTNQLVDRDSLGTASQKNFTPYVSPDNADVPISSSVYNAITSAVYGAYHPSGSKTIAELTSDLLVLDNIGNVYKITEDGVTTDLFIGGAGQTIHTGDNAVVIYGGQPNTFLFDLQSGSIDLTPYQTKALESAIEGATTVEGALGALSTDKQSKDLTTAVESATTVEGALGALSDNKQAKTLTTSVESQTTVEGALGALSTNKATQAEVNDIVNVLGAKNLTPSKEISQTKSEVTFTVDSDGVVTLNGTSNNTIFRSTISNNNAENIKIHLKKGTYTYSLCDVEITGVSLVIKDMGGQDILRTTSIRGANFTLSENKDVTIDWRVESGVTFSNTKFKAMIRPASIQDNTYQPYAMTNRELTDIIPSNASASNKLVAESDVGYFYQTSDVEGEYDANDFAVVGKTTRYCVKSPVHGYQVDGTTWWGFYETVCFRGGGYGYQTFRTMLGMPVMAIRQLYNTSWGDWEKLVTESDITPSGTQKTIHRNYTNIGPEVLFDEFGILTKTPTELINALKNKGYIIGTTRYTQLHCVINFVNSNANYVIVSDGTHSIDLKNGWIEFEGAFVSGTSTFGSEERWVMKLYNVLTCEMAIVTKRAGTSATPIMKSVTLT